MKRVCLFFWVVFVSVSCAKDFAQLTVDNDTTFAWKVSGNQKQNENTKTTLESNKLSWVEGDMIGVFIEGRQSNRAFTNIGGNDFSGGLITGKESAKSVEYYAYYPFQTEASAIDNIEAALPASQSAPFDPSANFMTAEVVTASYDEASMPSVTYNFSNQLFSIVKIVVKNTDETMQNQQLLGISLEATDGSTLAGKFSFDASSADASPIFSDSNISSVINMNYPDDAAPLLGNGTSHEFNLLVNPTTITGIKVIVRTTDYVFSINSSSEIQLLKGCIEVLPEININEFKKQNRVRTCILWGDSITNATVKDYLQKILGNDWKVVRGGIPGDTPLGIAGRQGGVPIVINSNVTVKYSEATQFEGFSSLWNSKAEEVGKGAELGSTYWFADGNCSLLNPCYIKNGDEYIACTITMDSDKKYYIKRNTDGEDITVKAGAYIYSHGSQQYRDAEVVVSYMGANSDYSKDYAPLAKMYQAMMDYATSEHFIAVGFHMGYIEFPDGGNRTYWTQDYCDKMTELFGNKYLDLKSVGARDADYIFKELGISKTDKDVELIAGTNWPSSWQTNYINNVHPNVYGSKAIAIMIKQRMQELGYMNY